MLLSNAYAEAINKDRYVGQGRYHGPKTHSRKVFELNELNRTSLVKLEKCPCTYHHDKIYKDRLDHL